MIVLSGDIGGTNTRLQLTEFADQGGDSKIIKRTNYSNHDFANFADIIDTFFRQNNFSLADIAGACFDVAGPIVDGEVKLTNLPWVIKTNDLKAKLKIDQVVIINDFVAIGYGLDLLQSKDLLLLQKGEVRSTNSKAYLGAGTGLGIGFVTYNQGVPRVYPTEGGHVDFAPIDDIQIELLKFLRKKYHRVSYERVLSGPGLVNIYQFVRSYTGFSEKENIELGLVVDGRKSSDVAAAVTEFATKHADPLAIQALNIFVRVYAAAAGNLALTILPFGGLYLVGGIAPKISSFINSKLFFDTLNDKGRMSALINSIPLYLVFDTEVGLQGAALYAKNLALNKNVG